jgi:hypothetical protein
LHAGNCGFQDEDSSGFWSLRETQAMVGWLRARNSALIDVPTIRQWPAMQPAEQPASHGWRYLRETVTEYALDVGDGELLLDHFLDGLAERSPESRRRQIDLGFAARYPPGHAIHRSRAVLAVGSRIAPRETSAVNTWRLCDVQGVNVGALSQHFEPETDMHCIEARVAAIHVRRPRDVAESYKSRINEQVQSFKPLVVNCGARHPADVRG